MKREYSIGRSLAKACKLELPLMPVNSGTQKGEQNAITHSKQISWQFQLLERRVGFFKDYLVIASEAYSRFTLILPYQQQLPTWQKIQEDFHQLWWDQLLLHLGRTQFVAGQDDIALIQKHFAKQEKSHCWLNDDQSLNGHIAKVESWLESFCHKFRVDRLNQDHAWNLMGHINLERIELEKEDGEEQSFLPLERYLDDSLYRFGAGLAEGGKDGAFPNPHRKKVALSVV